MAQQVRELMTADPTVLPKDAEVRRAAQAMRDKDIGNVLVEDNGKVCGIVTDRDLVVRGIAERDDISGLRLGDVCSENLVTVSPTDDADTAISRMRERAVRRIPVVENGKPVGVLSIGDAAMERDPDSALGDISVARGNA